MQRHGLPFRLSKAVALSVGVALMCFGCGAIPEGTYRNEVNCPVNSSPYYGSGGPAPNRLGGQCIDTTGQVVLAEAPDDSRATLFLRPFVAPDVFVGVSISGGGSRAANFGWAVLEQLNEIGVLQQVSAISTTSGGGLPGAYYALRGPDWDKGKELLLTDFLGKWIRALLTPSALFNTTFTHADRSDIMAAVFDEILLDHKTYKSLGTFQPGARPIWIANVTDQGRLELFTFSSEHFRWHLHSRIDSYPISHAVMASAAFPGVFNSVTLRSFDTSHQPVGNKRLIEEYKHLLDGGPSDNLGLESLRILATSHARAKDRMGKPDGRCLMILVDAFPDSVANPDRFRPDIRRWYDHFVDTNFLHAFDALLSKRRNDSLAYLGIGQSNTRNRVIGDVFIPAWSADEGAPRTGMTVVKPASSEDRTPPPDHFACKVWHIDMSATKRVPVWLSGVDSFKPKKAPNLQLDVVKSRITLDAINSQISTNFRLTGPQRCSPRQLQKTLYSAAHALVREDHESRVAVCDWMHKQNLTVPSACKAFPGIPPGFVAEMSKVSVLRPGAGGGYTTDLVAQCERE